jgi:hypothetical protein
VVTSHVRGIGFWDVDTGNLQRSLPLTLPLAWLDERIVLGPDGNTIAADGSRNVLLCNVTTGRIRTTSRAQDRDILRPVAFLPDGSSLLTEGLGDGLRLWETASGIERETFRPVSKAYSNPVISPDGRLIAAEYDYQEQPACDRWWMRLFRRGPRSSRRHGIALLDAVSGDVKHSVPGRHPHFVNDGDALVCFDESETSIQFWPVVPPNKPSAALAWSALLIAFGLTAATLLSRRW